MRKDRHDRNYWRHHKHHRHHRHRQESFELLMISERMQIPQAKLDSWVQSLRHQLKLVCVARGTQILFHDACGGWISRLSS